MQILLDRTDACMGCVALVRDHIQMGASRDNLLHTSLSSGMTLSSLVSRVLLTSTCRSNIEYRYHSWDRTERLFLNCPIITSHT